MHLWEAEVTMKLRDREISQQAELDRIVARTGRVEPGVRARLVMRLADWMVLSGHALRDRYEPATR